MKSRFSTALTSLLRSPHRVALVVICSGIAARLYLFFLNRSFWTDEAKLALNVVQRSFAGLLDPLDLDQAAPVGFLFGSKAMITLFGNSDVILRILPLVAGCAALYLMYRLAFLLLSPRPALLAVLLFTFGKFVLYFSTDFKQYSADVAVALLLTLMAVLMLREGPSPRRLVTLTACGVLGMAISFSGAFIVAGIAGTLLLNHWLKKEYRWVGLVGVVSLVWAGVFLLLMLRTLDPASTNGFLLSYWGDAFMPLPPWSDPLWLPVRIAALLVNPSGLLDAGRVTAFLYIGLVIAGGVSQWRRGWRTGLLLFLPLGFALISSALHRYPFADRLMLWAVPALIIAVVEGVRWLVSFTPRMPRIRWAAMAVLVLLIAWGPVREAGGDILNPKARQHIKPLLAYLLSNREDGDVLYVYHKSRNPFLYYYPQYGLLPEEFVLGGNFNGQTEPYIEEIVTLARSHRVWLLFSHTTPGGIAEKEGILTRLARLGSVMEEKEERSASLFLFKAQPMIVAGL